MKIPIDIGHASGTGAVGCGYEEHSLCVPIALHLSTLLKDAGHEPVIIDFPHEDNGEDLVKTRDAANAAEYEFGISIHCDAADNEFAQGAHACYRTQKGKRLGQCIMKYLGKHMPGRADKVKLRRDLFILRATKPVWALVECGFITSPQDVVRLNNTPQVIAYHIACGILDYIKLLEKK